MGHQYFVGLSQTNQSIHLAGDLFPMTWSVPARSKEGTVVERHVGKRICQRRIVAFYIFTIGPP